MKWALLRNPRGSANRYWRKRDLCCYYIRSRESISLKFFKVVYIPEYGLFPPHFYEWQHFYFLPAAFHAMLCFLLLAGVWFLLNHFICASSEEFLDHICYQWCALARIFQELYLCLSDPNLYFEVAFWSQHVKIIQINRAWLGFGRSWRSCPNLPLLLTVEAMLWSFYSSYTFPFYFIRLLKVLCCLKLPSDDIITLYKKSVFQSEWGILDTAWAIPCVMLCQKVFCFHCCFSFSFCLGL